MATFPPVNPLKKEDVNQILILLQKIADELELSNKIALGHAHGVIDKRATRDSIKRDKRL